LKGSITIAMQSNLITHELRAFLKSKAKKLNCIE